MLKYTYFLGSRALQRGCERSVPRRQRLGCHDSIARSVVVPAANPPVTKHATACKGILQS